MSSEKSGVELHLPSSAVKIASLLILVVAVIVLILFATTMFIHPLLDLVAILIMFAIVFYIGTWYYNKYLERLGE